MISLIWKEAREKLLWAVALSLISMYFSWARGYTFYGAPGMQMLGWSLGPVLMAFIMGASGYTSELTDRRAIFLLTRPVTWKGVLASKLIVNAGVILIAAVLAAAAYRLTCPPAYAAISSIPRLAEGVLYAVLFTGAAFLLGFACSGVFAGTTESAAFTIVQGLLLVCIFSIAGANSGGWWRYIMQLLWPLPLLVAGIVVVKSGIMLPVGERVRRYAFVAVPGIVILAAAAFLVPRPLINNLVSSALNCEYIDWSISPDGFYALGRDYRNIYWLDIKRDKCTKLEYIYEDYSARQIPFQKIYWMNPHTAYRIGYTRNSWFIRTYYLRNNNTEHYDISMGKLTDRDGYPSEVTPSPDGRIAAVSLSAGKNVPRSVVYADIAKRCKIKHQ